MEYQTGLFMASPEDIRAYWPHIHSYLESVEGGINNIFTPEELYREISQASSHFLWVALDESEIEGLVLTSFTSTPRGVTCWISGVNCTGDLKFFAQDLYKIEKWAFEVGAKEIAFEGRKGWKRLLASQQYGEETVMLRKPLAKIWSN